METGDESNGQKALLIHLPPQEKVPFQVVQAEVVLTADRITSSTSFQKIENWKAGMFAKERDLNSHLSLDVVFQNIVINRVKIVAAHVVVVVGHRVAELLAVIFSIIGLVAVAVVVVALTGKETHYYLNPSSLLLLYFVV